MTTKPHPLTSPRRILIAAAIFLLLAGGSIGALGLASADDGAEPLPETFGIAAMRGGDAGVYNRTVWVMEDGVWVAGETTSDAFEWGRAEAIRLPDGSWVAAHPRRSDGGSATVSTNGREMTVSIPDTDWFSVETRAAVASHGLHGVAAASSWDIFLGATQDDQQSVIARTTWEPSQPCGLTEALRRGPVSLADPITVSGPCTGMKGETTFHASAVETVQGLPAVRFDAVQGENQLSYWYHADISEPLRKVATMPLAEPQDGVEARRTETELVKFQSGDEADPASILLPTATSLPKIVLAPRQPWGPDDSGVDHPFPLSKAYQEAKADPTFGFGAYLAAHPEAYTADAEFSERMNQWSANGVEQARLARTWSILVIDGETSFSFRATQELQGIGFNAAGGGVTYAPSTYDFTGGAGESQGYPAASEMPKQLPTVASLRARAVAFLGVPETAPNAWTVQPACGAGGCDMSHMTVAVGRSFVQYGCAPDPTATCVGTYETSADYLGADDSGRVIFRDTVTTTAQSTGTLVPTGGSPSASASSSGGPEPGSERANGLAGVWSLPAGPVATGASVLSLLAAAAYYLAPLVKSGAVGLFSRVHGDRLLDHPVRARLHQLIEAKPGMHYQELVRQSGAGKSSVEHHLRKLADSGLVVARRSAGFTCYFPRNASRNVIAGAAALKSDGARRILACVQDHPGVSGQEVAARTGLDAATVSHHLQRMAEGGLVLVRREGRFMAVTAAPQAADVLAATAA